MTEGAFDKSFRPARLKSRAAYRRLSHKPVKWLIDFRSQQNNGKNNCNIYKFLTAHSVLHRAQHGFVRGRSVCSNLLESLNDWTVYVQSRNRTTIIYVDFSKAFDVVSHEKLFIGLQSYKIGGTVLLWLQRFFCGRTHQTKIGDSLSDMLFMDARSASVHVIFCRCFFYIFLFPP